MFLLTFELIAKGGTTSKDTKHRISSRTYSARLSLIRREESIHRLLTTGRYVRCETSLCPGASSMMTCRAWEAKLQAWERWHYLLRHLATGRPTLGMPMLEMRRARLDESPPPPPPAHLPQPSNTCRNYWDRASASASFLSPRTSSL
jgi:hypothetical protein